MKKMLKRKYLKYSIVWMNIVCPGVCHLFFVCCSLRYSWKICERLPRIKGTISNWRKRSSSQNRWECEESIVLSKRIDDNDCRKRESNEYTTMLDCCICSCLRVRARERERCMYAHTCVYVGKVSAKLFLILFSVLESKNCWLCTKEIKCDDENNKKRIEKPVGKRIEINSNNIEDISNGGQCELTRTASSAYSRSIHETILHYKRFFCSSRHHHHHYVSFHISVHSSFIIFVFFDTLSFYYCVANDRAHSLSHTKMTKADPKKNGAETKQIHTF